MEASEAPPLTLSGKSAGRDPMGQTHIIRSNTFQWALAVAGVFAVFVIVLFGFIYWQTDQYLIARSDKMIASQLNVIAGLPNERRLDWIDEHLEQDSRGVQYVGLFGADGRKMAGNLERFPPELTMNDSVQSVSVERTLPAGRENPCDPRNRPAHAERRRAGHRTRGRRNQGDLSCRRSGAGARSAACALLMPARWRVAEHARPKAGRGGNQRVQRIIAGDLRERLPHRDVDEPFSKLTVIVNGMLDEMETMIHALAGVGNDIAHDLRTPLTRARLALERGRTNATTLQQLETVVDKAIANIDQSLAIITALLRLAEIENSRRSAAFGTVSLHEMLQEVCDIYEPIAENKSIDLRVEARQRLSVLGDRDLLFEAVANLVDNAIKFTPEGGRVRH